MVNESIDLNKGADYVSYLSRTLTDQLVNFLNDSGIIVSSRWVSLMIIFIALLIFYVGMRITKPLVKWGLIIISIILLSGMLIPW